MFGAHTQLTLVPMEEDIIFNSHKPSMSHFKKTRIHTCTLKSLSVINSIQQADENLTGI